ncbi:MAG: hypothetical protein ACYTG6_13240 [Planctomycetota bacterium]|jgi:hypothetical protein
MTEGAPVVEISGRFADELVAREAADALNRWFRWILEGGEGEPPEIFEPLGVRTADYAWTLGEDVDWTLGPHARTLGEEVRLSVQTHDTYLPLAGLLRRLGAISARVVREGE